MITNRGAGVLLAATAFSVGLAAHHALPSEPDPRPPVVIYEDGSGVQYVGDQEVRTFSEDTFVWDCRTMGNRRCGPP